MPDKELETAQRRMFGCTSDEMRRLSARPLGGHRMLIMSILSDAQELIAAGHTEPARQMINRAKWVLMEYLDDKRPA